MAVIAVAPFVLKDVTLKIGADNYEKHVSSVTFTPSVSKQTWKGLGGNSYTDQGFADWTCEIEYAQDWNTTNSLSQYLHANEGVSVAAEFVPKLGTGGSKFAAQLAIAPGAIGGNEGAFLTASVSLGSTKPVRSAIV